MSGGAGNDSLDAFFAEGNNSLSGDAGNDGLSVGLRKSTVNGGAGTDRLNVGYGYYYYSATSGITTTLDASATNGTITAGSNSITFSSIEQFDIDGTDIDDTLIGGSSNDTLDGHSGNNSLSGGAGDDALSVGLGKSTVNGGAGTDRLSVDYSLATSGIIAILDAPTTSGTITAGSNSIIFNSIEQLGIDGTVFDDTLIGGAGNDTVDGWYGNDQLIGGGGADSFSFFSPYTGVDTITDFTLNQGDTIVVSASSFSFRNDLNVGAPITPEQFVQGTAAQDANDRFIYNIATGALSFDSDGTGSAVSVQFATLSNQPTLTSNSIFVGE